MIRFLMRGFDPLIQKFGASAQLEQLIGASVDNWAYDTVRTRLRGRGQYPPERAGQRYVRTGQLGDGWATQTMGPMMRAIYNPVGYAHWVVGDTEGQRQAWMHAGRWWLARTRILEAVPSLVRRIELRIARWFEGTGVAPGAGIRTYAGSVIGETISGPYAE